MTEVTDTGRETEAGDLDSIIADAVGGEVEPAQQADAVQDGQAGTPADADFDLPQHWSDDEKAKWKAVGPDQRALLLDVRKSLEKGYDTKFKAIADKRKQWKELKQIYAPLQGYLQMQGATKLSATRALVGAQLALMKQPDQALPWLAQQYAGSLTPEAKSSILQRLQQALGVQGTAEKPNPSDEYLDPRAAQEIAALKQQITQLGGYIQQSVTAQTHQAESAAQRIIDDFKAAKDSAGAPLHPYYEEVEPMVMRLLKTGMIESSLPAAEKLKQAYDQAIRLSPEIWERIDLEKKQAKAKADAEKRRKETEQAKTAARNVQGQSVSVNASKKLKLDDAIREAAGEAAA